MWFLVLDISLEASSSWLFPSLLKVITFSRWCWQILPGYSRIRIQNSSLFMEGKNGTGGKVRLYLSRRVHFLPSRKLFLGNKERQRLLSGFRLVLNLEAALIWRVASSKGSSMNPQDAAWWQASMSHRTFWHNSPCSVQQGSAGCLSW